MTHLSLNPDYALDVCFICLKYNCITGIDFYVTNNNITRKLNKIKHKVKAEMFF